MNPIVVGISMFATLGYEEERLPLAVLATGCGAIFYASRGGLRAVVITDLFQFILLFGGGVLLLFGGGVLLFSFDPNVRVTVVGTLAGTILW